jgi:hypothetical protein
MGPIGGGYERKQKCKHELRHAVSRNRSDSRALCALPDGLARLLSVSAGGVLATTFLRRRPKAFAQAVIDVEKS